MEDKYIASIIIATVGVLIGLALFTQTAQSVGKMTNLATSNNVTVTLPAFATVSDFAVCGQQNTSAVTIANYTTGIVYTTGNYTISQGTGTDGYLSTRINITASAQGAPNNLALVNCTYQPYGYVTSGGARNIAGLIVIFGALLIALVALPQARDWMKDFFK